MNKATNRAIIRRPNSALIAPTPDCVDSARTIEKVGNAKGYRVTDAGSYLVSGSLFLVSG